MLTHTDGSNGTAASTREGEALMTRDKFLGLTNALDLLADSELNWPTR